MKERFSQGKKEKTTVVLRGNIRLKKNKGVEKRVKKIVSER